MESLLYFSSDLARRPTERPGSSYLRRIRISPQADRCRRPLRAFCESSQTSRFEVLPIIIQLTEAARWRLNSSEAAASSAALGFELFGQLNPASAHRQYWLLLGSIALHGAILVFLLRPPDAVLLNPVSVALGHNGKSLTRIYWPNKSPDDSTHSSSDRATEHYRHQHFGAKPLTLNQPQVAHFRPPLQQAPTEKHDNSATQTLSAAGHGVQAGLPYGTLTRGQLYGDELMPALPIQTSDPVVFPWQLPTTPGNEVIEITIDERGEIVNKTVLQSLGPDIDNKCLAALDNWRFHPATRNGSPIPSKQDAIFPFKARG